MPTSQILLPKSVVSITLLMKFPKIGIHESISLSNNKKKIGGEKLCLTK